MPDRNEVTSVGAKKRLFVVGMNADLNHAIRVAAESPEEAKDLAWAMFETMTIRDANAMLDAFTRVDELNPDGTIVVATWSDGAYGQLVPAAGRKAS
jgi:hypothetical protein